jgi:hypothetical protein
MSAVQRDLSARPKREARPHCQVYRTDRWVLPELERFLEARVMYADHVSSMEVDPGCRRVLDLRCRRVVRAPSRTFIGAVTGAVLPFLKAGTGWGADADMAVHHYVFLSLAGAQFVPRCGDALSLGRTCFQKLREFSLKLEGVGSVGITHFRVFFSLFLMYRPLEDSTILLLGAKILLNNW